MRGTELIGAGWLSHRPEYLRHDTADAFQISQSALKARITAARQHLHARTTAEATQRAASCDLI